ncbi:heat shock 70 kDa protein 12A-like [Girardinichthys multiradiatus]|uniref:heat shock 70 kDa protein 12A-like n=1 Tax=Girardinichthys multiradiatus TaxID=208333 RepID=UPI001FAD3A3D|nr:heat shock 70 kDa protein 12A-like [Girardinichthys multiradiatus]
MVMGTCAAGKDDWRKRIDAANNYNYNYMKALDVFREVLRFLKDDVLKTINVHPEGGKFTASDFTWVLNVPAVWKDSAEGFMVEAAIQAGLVTEDTKDKLMLVLESEAALTWCLKLPSDGFFTQNHSRDSQDPSPGPTDAGTSCNDPPGSQVAVHFEKEPEETKVLLETQNRDGKRYLVVDCGDETIDFTVLEVLEGGTLKKLQEASREDLGGRTVDRKFKQFLREIFSDGVWKEYEENFSSEVQKMMYDFIRLKQVDEDVQISCSDNLREQAQKKKEIETFFVSVEGASWDEGVIRITREKLRSFFDYRLQGITKSLREELQKVLNIGSIVLVGGFAESQILRQHITDQFGPQYKVLCPLRPQEAVLKGAVELGRNPKLVSSQKKGPACLNWFS